MLLKSHCCVKSKKAMSQKSESYVKREKTGERPYFTELVSIFQLR